MPKPTRRTAADPHAPSARLKETIRARGLTCYALGKAADVDPGMIARFLAGERSLSLPTVDRLAAALGLRLVEARRHRAPVKLA